MDNYKLTFETWEKLATQYQDKFMDLDLYTDTYTIFCDSVEKLNAKILDIGCGPGNITRHLLALRPDYIIDGIDTSTAMLTLAKINNPTANFIAMDCRKLHTLTSKYEAIISGFCMPYLSKVDCAKFIKDCSSLLLVGGVFYFSVIEGENHKSSYETSSNGEHTMFVNYHEADYLKKGLKENNFELINLIQKNYQKSDKSISTHLIFIAKKQY